MLSAKSGARFGPVSYRATCSPSAVPIADPGLPPQQAGCPLAPSIEIACGREPEGQYYGDVEAAISQILKEKPELFDFTDTTPRHRLRPRSATSTAYNKGMVDIMTAKGYCAKHDGEELALKKGSNTSSEQYDVDLAGASTSGAARASTASAATRPRSDDARRVAQASARHGLRTQRDSLPRSERGVWGGGAAPPE